MSKHWRVLHATFAALVAGAMITGCGITTDSAPRDIGPGLQPFPIASGPPTPGTTAPTGSPRVYLVGTDDTHLVGSNRDVTSRDDLIRALLQGPSTQDLGRGFHSAIPLDAKLVRTSLDLAGVLTISLKLDPQVPGFVGSAAAKAFAQLVYTATDRGGVLGVQFQVNEQALKALKGDGTSTDAPVARSDYANLAPISLPDLTQPGGVATTSNTASPEQSTPAPTATASPTTVAPTSTVPA